MRLRYFVTIDIDDTQLRGRDVATPEQEFADRLDNGVRAAEGVLQVHIVPAPVPLGFERSDRGEDI